jgi:hypothetical protein
MNTLRRWAFRFYWFVMAITTAFTIWIYLNSPTN